MRSSCGPIVAGSIISRLRRKLTRTSERKRESNSGSRTLPLVSKGSDTELTTQTVQVVLKRLLRLTLGPHERGSPHYRSDNTSWVRVHVVKIGLKIARTHTHLSLIHI